MRGITTIIVLVLCTAAVSSAGQVWESTFDTDADGVVDLRTDNDDGDGEVMIGGNSGGVQKITTESQTNTLANKSGRAMGSTLGHTGSVSALYTFDWTFEAMTTSDAAEFFAGFTSSASPHSTRQFLGARFIRQVGGSGDHYLQVFGAWGSDGYTGSGRNLPAGQQNLGTTLPGRPLQLAIGYDGSTHILDVGLFDGTDGTELFRNTGDIREFDNLGVPPDSPALQNELNALALTHAGWTDFSAATDDIDTDWNMDSLRYYDDATGAFGAVVPEPAGALMMVLGLTAVIRRRR